MSWETVIGLEIHAQLLTKTKLFCGCPRTSQEEPNTKTCDICLGMPGSLPVLNEEAVKLALKAAFALGCRINETSIFARKNYFYPDLPKGYQISQYDKPLAEHGSIEIRANGGTKKIGITRIHMEEDAGKNIHDASDEYSSVDYNRSCVPLIEIVSEPDISSPKEASEYLKTLRLILLYNGICDGNMELGNLRCDANLSVRKKGDKKLGTKTELKNMNSFNFIARGLEYERDRHVKILEEGGKIEQETLLWDAHTQKTVAMRSKEEAHDYRYFEEPDLLPLILEENFISKVKNDPQIVSSQTLLERYKTYTKKHKIPESMAGKLITFPALYKTFESALQIYDKNPLRSATFVTDVYDRISGVRADRNKIAHFLSSVVEAEDKKEINLNTGKETFEKSLLTGKNPKEIIKSEGLTQISDESAIDPIIDKVMQNCPKEVEQYRNGKEPLFNFLFGQVMKETKGKVNPQVARKRLQAKLKE